LQENVRSIHKVGYFNGQTLIKGAFMQVQDVRVTIRVNRELKENAETLFDYLGLNMSNAVNIFLRKAVDQKGIPFTVNTGKEDFGGLNTSEVTGIFTNAVNQEVSNKQKKGLPVARYDTEKQRAYLEYADGAREYV
jgi:DNA-damage-inducible protein J